MVRQSLGAVKSFVAEYALFWDASRSRRRFWRPKNVYLAQTHSSKAALAGPKTLGEWQYRFESIDDAWVLLTPWIDR